MTRMKALEAVAAKVRIWCAFRPELDGGCDTFRDTQELFDAIQALDALPADPKPARGEVVEVAVWEERGTGRVLTVRAGSDIDKDYAETSLDRLGTTRLPLVKEDKS